MLYLARLFLLHSGLHKQRYSNTSYVSALMVWVKMVSCSLLETLVSRAKDITNIITQKVREEEYNKFKEFCKRENLRANHERDVNIACTYLRKIKEL